VNAGVLFFMLRKQDVFRPTAGWPILLTRISLATGVMGAILFWGVGTLDSWLLASPWERITRLSIWVVSGISVYLLTITLFGVRLAQFLLKKG